MKLVKSRIMKTNITSFPYSNLCAVYFGQKELFLWKGSLALTVFSIVHFDWPKQYNNYIATRKRFNNQNS